MENQERMNLKPGLVGSGIILLFMLLLSAWAWTQLPANASIPVHWGISGQPDRYGGKIEGLFTLPIAAAFIILLLCVLPLLEPRKMNLLKSRKAYIAIWFGLMVFFAILHMISILSALGKPINMNRVMPLLMGAIFVLLGNYLGKIRSNFFMGIRTPWTLSSELSWNKTHRLGGWLFVITGLLIIGTVFLENIALTIGVMIGSVFVILVISLVYSYLVWKADPEKQAMGRKAME